MAVYFAVQHRDGRFLEVVNANAHPGKAPRLYALERGAKQARSLRADAAEWSVVRVRVTVESTPCAD